MLPGMEVLAIIATFAGINLLGLMSPGPDFIMAIRNSLTYSRRTGIYTALGFAGGIAVHISYCLAGLGLIISQSILLFSIFKYAGAAYLLYIGVKSLFSKKAVIDVSDAEQAGAAKEDLTPWQAIKSGFLTNVLNPKATLFMLSMFTVVMPADAPAAALVGSGIVAIVSTALWFSLVAIFFTQKHVRKVFDRFQGFFNKTFGALLVLLGIKVATASQE